LWLARWLADGDRLDESRQRVASAGYHALHELARWLAKRDWPGGWLSVTCTPSCGNCFCRRHRQAAVGPARGHLDSRVSRLLCVRGEVPHMYPSPHPSTSVRFAVS
jgi:hypothetical protein